MKTFAALLLILCGCSESAKELTEWQQAMRKGSDDTLKTVEVKSDAILSAVKQNDTSIKAVWTKLEALDLTLSTLKPQTGKDGDPQSSPSPPESPAKANTQQPPVQVATPGTSQESLVELASRLYARGVNVHNRTEEELKAIDAQMQGVKSLPVQYQSRPTYSQPAGTVCVNGQCFTPKTVSRRGRR